MPRIRSIHPDACTSEKLALVSGNAERCYWRLQTHCDDAGRCEDHPRLIWAALFPLHEDIAPADVDSWLNALMLVGLVVRYESGGRRYLAVTQWGRFQHPQRPKPSTIPAPSATCTGHVRDALEMDNGHVLPGEGEGEGGAHSARTRAQPIPDEFLVSEEMIEWVERECPMVRWQWQTEKFVDWAKSASGRNTVKKDWVRAWRNWMRSEQEKART